MWHEARRQERKIRGMLVDYRRRAERRRDFYEKIKADPTQFLQIHGRQCKIHLDPAVAAAADSAVMMPWQGQSDNLIDRFDVRAHLDYIPPVKKEEEPEVTAEERQLNYERYRIIAQNSFLGITEEKFLKQLHLEEQYGYTEMKTKKEQRTGGTAIGFNYEEGAAVGPAQPQQPIENTDDESVDDSDSDLDVDLAINVSKMDPTQAHEMNKHGRNFGMSSNDFYSFLTNDLEEAETYRQAKEEEHEKALFSGRKSRRERRAHREKRLANRVISPPSYAARTSPTYPIFRESKSLSKSPSPENTGKITYITSFGGEDETPSSSKPTYADKVKYGKNKTKTQEKGDRKMKRSRSRSRERTYGRMKRKSLSPRRKNRRSRSKSRRSRSYSRSRRSRSSRSRRSRSRSKSYKRSRSRSRGRYDKGRSGNYGKNYRSRKSSTSSSSSSSSSLSSKSSRSVTPKKRHPSTSSSRSKSPVPVKSKSKSPVKESPPKILTRYYGRKKSDQSSSDLSESSVTEDIDMKPAVNTVSSDTKLGHGNNSGTPIKKITTKMTIQERLKRKRQALLNKQYRADKIAEQLKTEREKQEQQTREDELREMAIKLRRRQREKRHAYDSNRSSSSSDTDTNSKGRTSSTERRRPSRSPSPRRRSRDRDSRKRDVRRNSREHSRERDRRARSRDQRDRSSERRYQRKRESPTIRRSPLRYEVNRENDRKDRWRDDRDERDNNKQKHNKSLVDY